MAMCSVSDGTVRIAHETHMPLRATISPNGQLLAAAYPDRAIRISDTETSAELTCLQGHDDVVQAIAFSPDGLTLAGGTSAGSVTLWHVASWQELGHFKTSLAAIKDLTFSPTGNSLAIGGQVADGTGQVLVWDTKPSGD